VSTTLGAVKQLIKDYYETLAQNAKTLVGLSELTASLYAVKVFANEVKANGYELTLKLGNSTAKVSVKFDTKSGKFVANVSGNINGVSVELVNDSLPVLKIENKNSVTNGSARLVVSASSNEDKVWLVYGSADTLSSDVKYDNSGNVVDYSYVSGLFCRYTAGLGGKCFEVQYGKEAVLTLNGRSAFMGVIMPLDSLESLLEAVKSQSGQQNSQQSGQQGSQQSNQQSGQPSG